MKDLRRSWRFESRLSLRPVVMAALGIVFALGLYPSLASGTLRLSKPIPVRSDTAQVGQAQPDTRTDATGILFFKHPAAAAGSENFITDCVQIGAECFPINDLVATPGLLPSVTRAIGDDSKMLEDYLTAGGKESRDGFCSNSLGYASAECHLTGEVEESRQLEVADIRNAISDEAATAVAKDTSVAQVVASAHETKGPYAPDFYPATILSPANLGTCQDLISCLQQYSEVFAYGAADLGEGIVASSYDPVNLEIDTHKLLGLAPLAYFRKDAALGRLLLSGYDILHSIPAWSSPTALPFMGRMSAMSLSNFNPIAIVPIRWSGQDGFAVVNQATVGDLDEFTMLDGDHPFIDRGEDGKWAARPLRDHLRFKDNGYLYPLDTKKMPHRVFSYVTFYVREDKWDSAKNPNVIFRPVSLALVGPGAYHAAVVKDGERQHLLVASGEEASDGKYYLYKVDPISEHRVWANGTGLPIILPTPIEISPPTGFAPYGLASADIDNDGCGDVALTFRGKNTMPVGGGGQVRFSPSPPLQAVYGTAMFSNVFDVHFGRKDISSGKCSFQASNDIRGAPPYPATETQLASVALADVDGDGKIDVLVGDLVPRQIPIEEEDAGKYTAFAYLYHMAYEMQQELGIKLWVLTNPINPERIRVGHAVADAGATFLDLVDMAAGIVSNKTFGVAALAVDKQAKGSNIAVINGMPLALPKMGCPATGLLAYNGQVASGLELMVNDGALPQRCEGREVCNFFDGSQYFNLPFFADDPCCTDPCDVKCENFVCEQHKEIYADFCGELQVYKLLCIGDNRPYGREPSEAYASFRPDEVVEERGRGIISAGALKPAADPQVSAVFLGGGASFPRLPRGQAMLGPREIAVVINMPEHCGDNVYESDKEKCDVVNGVAQGCTAAQSCLPDCTCACPQIAAQGGCVQPKVLDEATCACICLSACPVGQVQDPQTCICGLPPPICGDGVPGGSEQCEKGIACTDPNQLCDEVTCACMPKKCDYDGVIDKPQGEECDTAGMSDADAKTQVDQACPADPTQGVPFCVMNSCKCGYQQPGCLAKANVQCKDSTQCPAGQICDSACSCVTPTTPPPSCATDPNAKCKADGDCQAGQICDSQCQCRTPVVPPPASCATDPNAKCKADSDCQAGQICDSQCQCRSPVVPPPVLPPERPDISWLPMEGDCSLEVLSFSSNAAKERIDELNRLYIAGPTGRSDYQAFVEDEQRVRVICQINNASLPGAGASLSLANVVGEPLPDSADRIRPYALVQTSGSVFLNFRDPAKMQYKTVMPVDKPIRLSPLAAQGLPAQAKAVGDLILPSMGASLSGALPMTDIVSDMPVSVSSGMSLINDMIQHQVLAIGAGQSISVNPAGMIQKGQAAIPAAGQVIPGKAVHVITMIMPTGPAMWSGVEGYTGAKNIEDEESDVEKVKEALAGRAVAGQRANASVFADLPWEGYRNYKFDLVQDLYGKAAEGAVPQAGASQQFGILTVNALVMAGGSGGCKGCYVSGGEADFGTVAPWLAAILIPLLGIAGGRMRRCRKEVLLDKIEGLEDMEDIRALRKEPSRPLAAIVKDLEVHGKS